MSQDVNTPVDEQLDQNTNTNEDSTQDEVLDSTPESNEPVDNNTESDSEKEQESESDSNELTSEQLENMSDDEFMEYMDSGKLPAFSAKSTDTTKEKQKEPEKATPDKAKVISKPKPTEDTKEESANIDYKDTYKRIFAPFKANGKEITPRTVEDVISLMQMGANYTKKMQVMAPMRKIVESINKANINEEDLNFLIDLHKGDKEAIKELLKKNNIDLMDVDLDDVSYKHNKKNIASDDDVNFADTLSDVSESIPRIQEIINNVWDSDSRAFILKNPQAMRALHEEIQMGRFDKVQQQLEIEKTFGRYKGTSDVEAYIDLVNKMVANEKANKNTPSSKPKSTPDKPSKSVPDKRKAAPSGGNSAKSSSSLTVKDLFSMSDEDFNKLGIKDLV